MNFVQTLLFMLDGTLSAQILGNEAADAIEKAFVFAMIWSMGSALTGYFLSSTTFVILK
jgi:hypothetical protein